MLRILAIGAAIGLTGCATKPITPDEFVAHGRFRAEQCEPAKPPAERRGVVQARDGAIPPQAESPEVARCRHETREKAFAECRALAQMEANRAGAQWQGPGVGGAVAQLINAQAAGVSAIRGCMDAKGFAWTTPR